MHGASEIARSTRRLFLDARRAGLSEPELARLGARLLASQPAMAPLYRIVNDACLGRIRAAPRARLSLQGVLPRGRSSILTYSHSSTVREALISHRHRIARVICSEGRPGGEGERLARRLAREGIPVTLLTEAELFDRVEDADVVCVGADALVVDGLVNKVGTRALAQLARSAHRPFYALTDREKILPEAFSRFMRLLPWFDKTPYRLVSGIVTDAGVMGRRAVAREMEKAKISRELLRALRQRV